MSHLSVIIIKLDANIASKKKKECQQNMRNWKAPALSFPSTGMQGTEPEVENEISGFKLQEFNDEF